MHIEERTLDINKQGDRVGQIQPIILRRGETGRTQIQVNVTSDGAPYDLSDYTPRMCAYLPDGKFAKDAAHTTKSGTSVIYTVHSDLTSAPGDIRIFYIELISGDDVLTTDAIPLIVLDDISISDEVAGEYRSTIDEMIAEVEKRLQDVNDTNQSVKAAEAERVKAEQGRVTAEDARVSNESARQANENTRKADETSRQQAETSRSNAEADRVKAEQGRVTAENGRVTAENGRVSAESTRVTEQAKNNADQAANNLAAAQIAPHVCVSGEYDASSGKPTVTGSVEGRIYLVPSGGAGDDKYTEWMWLHGEWERVGTSSGGTINYITTDQVDDVVADKQPQGDTVLSLTGLSYFWAKIKDWASNTFRKAADALQSNDIADNAITSGKIASNAVTNEKIAGTVPVNKGGTGNTTLTSNQVLLGNGINAIGSTAASGTGALCRTSTTGAPAFGTVPITAGGTGESTLEGAKETLGIKALEDSWDSIFHIQKIPVSGSSTTANHQITFQFEGIPGYKPIGTYIEWTSDTVATGGLTQPQLNAAGQWFLRYLFSASLTATTSWSAVLTVIFLKE